MEYEAIATYAQKGQAWTVLWDIRNQFKAQGIPPKSVKIDNSTIMADSGLVDKVEKIMGKYNFRVKRR